MRLINEFSWSFSRANTFSECQKKYWYTYYGGWEGWPKTYRDERPSIDPLASHLYMLKQMQRLPTFVGSAVHSTIEHFLKESRVKNKPSPLESLLQHGESLFEKGLVDAKGKTWRVSPKKHTNLFEYYYNEPPSPDDLAAAKEKVSISLTNWYSSPVVQKLIYSQQAEWISIEELASFKLQDRFKIIVVIDFCLKWQENVAILFDWKTGEESEKAENQLYCYALFASHVLGFSFDRLILSPFYLFKNSYKKIGFQQEEPLSQSKLEEVESEIIRSCVELSTLHSTEPAPDPRLFAYTEQRQKCASCSFKEVCIGAKYENLPQDELRELVIQLEK